MTAEILAFEAGQCGQGTVERSSVGFHLEQCIFIHSPLAEKQIRGPSQPFIQVELKGALAAVWQLAKLLTTATDLGFFT